MYIHILKFTFDIFTNSTDYHLGFVDIKGHERQPSRQHILSEALTSFMEDVHVNIAVHTPCIFVKNEIQFLTIKELP